MATPTIMAGTEVSDSRALLRLCQLVSPALPVGAYAYSQGLEYAVEAGWICNEFDAYEWVNGLSRYSVGTLDLPILVRLHRAWASQDAKALGIWNAQLIASRETAELRDEERHLGRAMARVLIGLGLDEAAPWLDAGATFAAMFALAAVRWEIALGDALQGYLWTWTENQVLAAIKLIPLGQTAGQRLLHRLVDSIPGIVLDAQSLPDESIGSGAISQPLASALHETQYSRLFRS